MTAFAHFHTKRLVAALALSLVAASAPAQTQQQAKAARAGKRVTLPVRDEVALARSAAPATISAGARVLMLADTGYVVADSGTSSVTCVVNRSWDRSVEPHCYDEEGAATVMRVELRRNYLRHAGKSEPDIEVELAKGILDGTYRMPSRPALSFMMSASQVLYDDNGTYVGKWRPHLMIYYPNLTNEHVGLPARPEMRVGMVSGAGTAEANLMIVMPTFVELRTLEQQEAPRPRY